MDWERASSCWSSSIDSHHPTVSSSSATSLSHSSSRDLITDLRLGLSISSSHQEQDIIIHSNTQREEEEEVSEWGRRNVQDTNQGTLFVKVYMDGIPIGRKLDLLAHDGYHALITTLHHMFDTIILWADVEIVHSERFHVLTYEDKEGDWLIVGDVPWEMFLTSVKRLKITRADKF